MALVDKLQDEKRKQQDHVDRVMIRLKQVRLTMFQDVKKYKEQGVHKNNKEMYIVH